MYALKGHIDVQKSWVKIDRIAHQMTLATKLDLLCFIQANQAGRHGVQNRIPHLQTNTPLVNNEERKTIIFYIKIV
jgi:hypothetical protein